MGPGVNKLHCALLLLQAHDGPPVHAEDIESEGLRLSPAAAASTCGSADFDSELYLLFFPLPYLNAKA